MILCIFFESMTYLSAPTTAPTSKGTSSNADATEEIQAPQLPIAPNLPCNVVLQLHYQMHLRFRMLRVLSYLHRQHGPSPTYPNTGTPQQ